MGTFYNEDYNYSLKHYGVPGMRWKNHKYTGSSSEGFDYSGERRIGQNLGRSRGSLQRIAGDYTRNTNPGRKPARGKYYRSDGEKPKTDERYKDPNDSVNIRNERSNRTERAVHTVARGSDVASNIGNSVSRAINRHRHTSGHGNSDNLLSLIDRSRSGRSDVTSGRGNTNNMRAIIDKRDASNSTLTSLHNRTTSRQPTNESMGRKRKHK